MALVVAETYEQARHAARLVKVTYNAENPMTDTEAARDRARMPGNSPPPQPRGNREAAMQNAPVKIDVSQRSVVSCEASSSEQERQLRPIPRMISGDTPMTTWTSDELTKIGAGEALRRA